MSPNGPFTRPLAVITGASSGIGEVFAHRLADRGHDLVLVARSTETLDALAKAVTEHARVRVEVVTADLGTTAGVDLVAHHAAQASVLVNSAGYGSVGSVVDLDAAGQVGQIRLNVEALTVLSRMAAAGMMERKAGAIINIGSTAGFQPIPYEAVYAATKAYVASFSQGLAEEVGGSGVKVLLVCPGYTATGFADRAGAKFTQLPSLMVSTPEHVVDTALRDLDHGRSVSIPGYLNAAIAAGSKVSPTWLTRKVSGVLTKRTM